MGKLIAHKGILIKSIGWELYYFRQIICFVGGCTANNSCSTAVPLRENGGIKVTPTPQGALRDIVHTSELISCAPALRMP